MDGISITLSLMADTQELLSALTVQAQVNFGMKLHFREFSQLKNGKFVCWYEVPYSIYVEKLGNGEG